MRLSDPHPSFFANGQNAIIFLAIVETKNVSVGRDALLQS